MKLLNELISVRRVDDEHDSDLDQEELDYMEPDGEEGPCPDCECDPCECEDKGDEGDIENLEDLDSEHDSELDDEFSDDDLEDELDDESGSISAGYGYDEFDLPADDTISPYHEYSDEESGRCSNCKCDPCMCDYEDNEEEPQYRTAIKDLTNGKYIMTVRSDERTLDLKVWFTKNPANAGKFHPNEIERIINSIRSEVPAIADHQFKMVKIQAPRVPAWEVEDEEMGLGAYGQQGSHMGGAKETDSQETDYNSDAADELDLNDEMGDNDDAETSDQDDEKLDAITDKASEDPDRQGVVRTVKGAHLIYKRQTEDGTYEELWIYNVGNMRDELEVRKAILSGTDIPTTKTVSPDGTQTYELWSSGNAEMLQIKGLPN